MVGPGRVKSRTVLPIVIYKFKPKYAVQRLLGLPYEAISVPLHLF